MDNESTWEKGVIEKLALGSLAEQRRKRRWGIFFKLIMVAYLGVLLVVGLGGRDGANSDNLEPHVGIVDLKGPISMDSNANAERVTSGLRSAFESKNTQAVVLRINSPGGSPVQAGMIYDEIKRLRGKHPDKPLYAVVEEVCASGGYYVAVAADEIYVNRASLVGSIGVIMGGFGFVDGMKSLGVERRLITAGGNKGFLDPFSDLKDGDVAHAKSLVSDIHEQFIEVVRQGRGDRLQEDPELFSGLAWTGARSVELGLADGLGSVGTVVRDVVGLEKVVDYSEQDSLAERLAERVGMVFGRSVSMMTGFSYGMKLN